MPLEVVIPVPLDENTAETPVAPASLAPRPPRSSVAGPTELIGLVDNGKHNAGKLLQELAGMLISEQLAGDRTMHTKPSASRPMTENERDRMAARSRLVISGVGD